MHLRTTTKVVIFYLIQLDFKGQTLNYYWHILPKLLLVQFNRLIPAQLTRLIPDLPITYLLIQLITYNLFTYYLFTYLFYKRVSLLQQTEMGSCEMSINFKPQTVQQQDTVNPKQSKSQLIQKKKAGNKKALRIIGQCSRQNQIFKEYYKLKNWKAFHSSHYDWWAFPIDQLSSRGQQYKVCLKQLTVMNQSKQFIKALRTNAIMVCEAWGWDLQLGQYIETKNKYQKWQNWPIRLYKMTKSLQIFNLYKQFKNAKKLGNLLYQKGYPLKYGNRDFTDYFKHSKQMPESQEYQSLQRKQQKNNKLKQIQTK